MAAEKHSAILEDGEVELLKPLAQLRLAIDAIEEFSRATDPDERLKQLQYIAQLSFLLPRTFCGCWPKRAYKIVTREFELRCAIPCAGWESHPSGQCCGHCSRTRTPGFGNKRGKHGRLLRKMRHLVRMIGN